MFNCGPLGIFENKTEYITNTLKRAAISSQIITETIPALQELKKEGLIRHIGITGLPLDIYTYILDR